MLTVAAYEAFATAGSLRSHNAESLGFPGLSFFVFRSPCTAPDGLEVSVRFEDSSSGDLKGVGDEVASETCFADGGLGVSLAGRGRRLGLREQVVLC